MKSQERALIAGLHTTAEDIPENAIIIDATAPLEQVVDKILETAPSYALLFQLHHG